METILKLRSDKRVDGEFLGELEKEGFEVQYSKFEEWNHIPFVISRGNSIPTVTKVCRNNGYYIVFRRCSEVISDIMGDLDNEKE